MTSTTSPTMTRRSENKIWPRSTRTLLLLVGTILALASFTAVMLMPTLPWPPAQDTELRAMYSAYRSTGWLMIKEAAEGGFVAAAWNDAPGSYVTAAIMSHVTASDSPYPGLKLAQAFLVALPLTWLPLATARIFRRARAGYALILAPALMWLVNGGTVLLGTQLGLLDPITDARVSTSTGLTGSIVFAALAVVLLFTTFRLSRRQLVILVGGVTVLSAIGNLFGVLAGVGIAVAAAALWWKSRPGRHRALRALTAAVIALLLAFATQWAADAALDAQRAGAIGASDTAAPVAARPWDSLLAEITSPSDGTPDLGPAPESNGLVGVDAQATPGTPAYRDSVRDAYFATLAEQPGAVAHIYATNAASTIKNFGAMIIFAIVGVAVALTRRAQQRRPLTGALLVATPTLLLGLLPPMLAGSALDNTAQLSAALGLLCVVALGALIWSVTSMPSHVRSVERTRVGARTESSLSHALRRTTGSEKRYSVVVPTRNGVGALEPALDALGGRLTRHDEIIVVENGSTDGTPELLERIKSRWNAPSDLILATSAPGLGEALRTGALRSRGRRLLLTADDLPFAFTDLDEFEKLPSSVAVAIGSKAHPDSRVARGRLREVQSRAFRFLRAALLQSAVGDSQGTLWVDGGWGRSFARLSRETGLMWTTELVLAAEQQSLDVREVPVSLSTTHESGPSRFRLADAWQSFVGFTRLAVYKDDYVNEEWERSTHPSVSESTAN